MINNDKHTDRRKIPITKTHKLLALDQLACSFIFRGKAHIFCWIPWNLKVDFGTLLYLFSTTFLYILNNRGTRSCRILPQLSPEILAKCNLNYAFGSSFTLLKRLTESLQLSYLTSWIPRIQEPGSKPLRRRMNLTIVQWAWRLSTIMFFFLQ